MIVESFNLNEKGKEKAERQFSRKLPEGMLAISTTIFKPSRDTVLGKHTNVVQLLLLSSVDGMKKVIFSIKMVCNVKVLRRSPLMHTTLYHSVLSNKSLRFNSTRIFQLKC